jgi:RNA polymerase sigma-70 factor (ECF subfamily)
MLFGLFSRKNITGLSDQALLELVRKNNSDALGELFNRYSPLVMGLCVKYMKNVQAAEDVMMELFEKLAEKIAKSDIQNFKNWIYSVSRNECLMALRKNKLSTSDIEESVYLIENKDESLLREALTKEAKLEKLEHAITQLKDEQKQCIELFYLHKNSYDEIVRKTGYELKKVKSYIQNGKRNLKMILEKDSEFRQ